MRILITNDDGIMAEGIYALAKILEKDHEVILVAPDTQKSAQSHAITLFQPLIIKEVKLEGLKSKAYSVSGTPADCVRAAREILSDGEIDLVFSGINMGLNSGMDILYSGTVSAAIEANIYSIPSIAVSTEWDSENMNYDIAAKYAKKILDDAKDKILQTNIVLNINVPKLPEEKIHGIKVCKIGGIVYDYYFLEESSNGEKHLTLKGRKREELESDTDRFYLSEGYVTVTPLHYDLTNFNLLNEVKSWI